MGVALHRWSCPSASWETLVIIDINLASIDYDSDQLQDHSLALDTTPRRRTALTRRDETLWKITIIMNKRKTNKQRRGFGFTGKQTFAYSLSNIPLLSNSPLQFTRSWHECLTVVWLSKQQQEKTLMKSKVNEWSLQTSNYTMVSLNTDPAPLVKKSLVCVCVWDVQRQCRRRKSHHRVSLQTQQVKKVK